MKVAGPTPDGAAPAWGGRDELCVVEPPDGGAGSAIYAGSGRQVADRIAHVVERSLHTEPVRLAGRTAPLAGAAARRCAWAIVPTIVQWERHNGALLKTAHVEVDVAVRRPGDREPVRSVHFEMAKTRPNVPLASLSLPKQFDDAVVRLMSAN